MKDLFFRTREAFSASQDSQKILHEMKVKKNRKVYVWGRDRVGGRERGILPAVTRGWLRGDHLRKKKN